MSWKEIMLALTMFLALVNCGESKLHLQASFTSESDDPIQKVVLNCTTTQQSLIQQQSDSPVMDMSQGHHHHVPGSQMEQMYGNIIIKLNDSVLDESTTSLLNYQVLGSSNPLSYIAQFELQQSEKFVGSFVCESGNGTNVSVSNEVLFVYEQLECYIEGITMGTLNAIMIALILLWVITFALLLLSCVFNWKLHRALGHRKVLLEASSPESPKELSPSLGETNRQEDNFNPPSLHEGTPKRKQFPDDSNTPLYFTSSGYAVPACKRVSYQFSADTTSLYSNCSSAMDSLVGLDELDSHVVKRVLKYLTHSSNCNIPMCPCMQIKKMHNAYMCGKNRSEADFNNPLYALSTSSSRHSIYCPDHDLEKITYPKLEATSTTTADETRLQITFIDAYTVTFNSSGGVYTSKQHGFSLKIPSGAVPQGKTINIEIGVCLNSPLFISSKSMPVSPILKLCVAGDPQFRFLKPVEITLPHYLDITDKDDIKSLGLQFVKANHNQYCFHETDGKAEFEPQGAVGTLSTDHFCCYCITAKKEVDLTKIKYRLVKIVPKDTETKKWNVHFCVTYFLSTCLQALEKQFSSRDYTMRSLEIFKFSSSSPDASIEISFEQKLAGGWYLNLENPRDKIYASEVEFWRDDPEELPRMEAEGHYPPRFELEVSGRRADQTTHAAIHFKGTAKELKVVLMLEADLEFGHNSMPLLPFPPHLSTYGSRLSLPDYIRLQPPPQQPIGATQSVQSSNDSLNAEPSDRELMDHVASEVATKWRDIGLQLGLSTSDLNTIAADHYASNRRIMTVFEKWRAQETSPYQWSALIEALRSPGVNEVRLARDLRLRFGSGTIQSSSQMEE